MTFSDAFLGLFILAALEGSPEAQPVSVVQRSASLSAGDVTPSAKTSGEVTQSVERRPSIEELRKQVSVQVDGPRKSTPLEIEGLQVRALPSALVLCP